MLTLIIVCDESEFPSALEASMAAGHEHPSRILLVVTGRGAKCGAATPKCTSAKGTPGEVVVIRMRGAVASASSLGDPAAACCLTLPS